MHTFGRASDGSLTVTLLEGEAAMLKMLLTEVRKLVSAPDADNAAARRLYPRAYLDPTEENAEQQWQSLVHDDLVDGRVRAFDTVWMLVDGATPQRDGSIVLHLDAEQEELFLGSVNDLRLALAALLEADSVATEDDVEPEGAPAAAGEVQAEVLLQWLLELVAEHVDLLLDEMPEEPGSSGA